MKKILFLILVLFAFCFTINHKVNAEENFDEDNINSISSSGIIPATTFEFMTFEEIEELISRSKELLKEGALEDVPTIELEDDDVK